MADRPTKLSDADVQAGLREISSWTLAGGKLHREYAFTNFVEAFGFMASAALVAESMNHHPEWSNVYRTVKVDLSTHDAGGITKFDFDLAKKMESLAAKRAAK
jgi:4a-hydroxytetrahydrobiopterin dehydratase